MRPCGTNTRDTNIETPSSIEVELESGKPSCQLEKSLIVARTFGIEVGDLRTAQAALTISDDDLDFLPTFGDGR